MDHFLMTGELDIGRWDKSINIELEVLNTTARTEQMGSVVRSMGQPLNWSSFDPVIYGGARKGNKKQMETSCKTQIDVIPMEAWRKDRQSQKSGMEV